MRFVRGSVLATFALGAFVFLPHDATAQASLGLSAGVSFANLSGDDVENTDTKTGLVGGVDVAFPLSDLFSIAPGFYYVQKGTKLDDRIEGVNVEASLGLDYIEIPILGVFTVTGADRPVGVSLFLGPSIAFEVSCSVEAEAGGLEFEGDCDEGDVEQVGERKKTDFGAIFGAGLAFPLSESLNLTVNGGLDLGLRSLDDSPEDNDVKNSVWFLTAGVRIPFGG